MADAQDANVRMLNWQWPLTQQVKLIADMGLAAAALELGDDLEAPTDPVIAAAAARYNTGLDLVGERLVDHIGELYVGSRCLIYEVYNHAGFQPQADPPEEWECDPCVATGDCGR